MIIVLITLTYILSGCVNEVDFIDSSETTTFVKVSKVEIETVTQVRVDDIVRQSDDQSGNY